MSDANIPDLQTLPKPPALNPLFRPTQYEIISYQRGRLGVAAVPGSGKTFTLAYLAANLVRHLLEKTNAEPSEVLVVTFTNVAADSFKRRLSDILRQRRMMLPYIGYRVRTLHGLAHDIIQERPGLAGLSDDFAIIDERTSNAIIGEVVRTWWRDHGAAFTATYVDPAALEKRPSIREELPDLGIEIAQSFIRSAKDRELDLTALHSLIDSLDPTDPAADLPLARFSLDVYDGYQRALTYRGAVDFDDLARLALRMLRTDSGFRRRLQRRWPYILEDEAQDSSLLQQELLRLLSDNKNWVRVGDPNQAINTTFTTANPQSLRDFLHDKQVKSQSLTQAGRSAPPIINLANALVQWSIHEHPAEPLRGALLDQTIFITSPGDLQGNPASGESSLYAHYTPGQVITSNDELKFVAESLARWLPEHGDQTVAILVPDNMRGFHFVEVLRARQIAYEELLNSTTDTRLAAKLLRDVLGYLAAPVSNKFTELAQLYKAVWWPLHLGLAASTELGESDEWLATALVYLKAWPNAEAWLWPEPAQPSPVGLPEINADLLIDLRDFRDHVRRWLEAVILPIDQLVLTINQDLFTRPPDIALGYKFAAALRGVARRFPDWRLPEFVDELEKISQNERKFLGFATEEVGYNPRPGIVTVSTYHKAKGLEWDRVYLTGVSSYAFPAMAADDIYPDEKWFARGHLNLKEEALAQLKALIGTSDDKRLAYVEGDATSQARIGSAAERLRLLYVGITRARRDLCVTWNSGRFGNNRPALPLIALMNMIQKAQDDRASLSENTESNLTEPRL